MIDNCQQINHWLDGEIEYLGSWQRYKYKRYRWVGKESVRSNIHAPSKELCQVTSKC